MNVDPDGLNGHVPIETTTNMEGVGDSWKEVGKRKRSLPTDDDMNKYVGNKKTSGFLDPKEGTSKDNQIKSTAKKNIVIVVKSTEEKAIFTKPRNVTKLLNESPFGKYIIQNSVMLLGRGVGCKFEIPDLQKLEVDLGEINKLGPHSIRCWVPKSIRDDHQHTHYGKVGPIDTEEDINDIKDDIRSLDNCNTEIIDVERVTIKKYTNDEVTVIPTLTMKIKFQGPLPDQVAIGFSVYKVYPWINTISRCFNCWRFGHGRLSCRATVRCARCSRFHKSEGCINDPYCYFCKGSHAIKFKQCPVYQEALKISKAHAGETSGAGTPITLEIQKLNPTKSDTYLQRSNPIPSTSSPYAKLPTHPNKPNLKNKSYAQVLATMEDTDIDITDDDASIVEYPPLSSIPNSARAHSKQNTNSRFFQHSDLRLSQDNQLHQEHNFQQERESSTATPAMQNQNTEVELDDPEYSFRILEKFLEICQNFCMHFIVHKSFKSALIRVSTDIIALISSSLH